MHQIIKIAITGRLGKPGSNGQTEFGIWLNPDQVLALDFG
jgi:hypothetical protein